MNKVVYKQIKTNVRLTSGGIKSKKKKIFAIHVKDQPLTFTTYQESFLKSLRMGNMAQRGGSRL